MKRPTPEQVAAALPKAGDRIMCIHMPDDPHPIPHGMTGTVTEVNPDFGTIEMEWDNGRTLNLVIGTDNWAVVDPHYS